MSAPGLRLPPHSIEAEQSVLGALLLSNEAIDRIGSLRPEHFYRDDHRRIFVAICTLINAGKPADIITVFNALETSGDAERIGGLAYLGEIANNTPSAANIHRYAENVADRAMLRALMAAGEDIAARTEQPGPTQAKLEFAQARVMELCDSGASREPRTVQEVMLQCIDRIQSRYDSDTPPGLETGFADIDSRSRVLQPGNLIILAARPGMGKTALSLRIAANVAESGAHVLVSSMEMQSDQLGDRLLSCLGRIPIAGLIGERPLNDADWGRMTAAQSRIHQMPLTIDDEAALTLWDIRTKARQAKRRMGGLGLIVIDYLQLMSGEGDNRTQEVGSISRGLKALAKDMGVPVIALSQLNRGVEQRPNKRPTLSDLRESGDIEADADVVWALYRDEAYNPDTKFKGLAELLWLKNRSGKTGGCTPLAWVGEHVFFGNSDRFAYAQAAELESRSKPRRSGYFSDDD
ncbi:MAG: replicative DNA helicase [Methyloversatilis sp.]|nr:replicative DNA helicase [Methyloversatilis sp.]MBP6194375.1 replicative DNA helicase [Methyloversatilis sp.]